VTTYKVFKEITDLLPESESLGEWTELGEYGASNPQGAIRAAVLDMNEADREKAPKETFAATASSGWNVHVPKVNVKTTVSF